MRTCFPVPYNPGQAYFFHGAKYARVKFTPSSSTEEITYGPASISQNWKTLTEAGFDSVDAALPVPGHPNQVYFFSGSKYVKIQFTPSSTEERIVFGPRRIGDKWKTLAQAGFFTVDAVLPVPGHVDQAYFFSGDEYVKVRFTAGTSQEEILYGPRKIWDEWKTLAKAGFSTIDAILPVPGHENDQAYFFSGSQYCRIKFTPSSPHEEITYGPASVPGEWKSLTWGW
ncbi:Hemopexin-like domain-containing protein [Apodospora peruviana]|uniref:Hemopexin-like domain-containing protein n=1 Tax=Apodospora peruviana TaxID=516989 RepID=A0AAE0HTM6_9PEZI|nr:Hemopexin-like domain-containing protein [Apodospora peruviana]